MKIGRKVIDCKVAHFLLDMCNFVCPGVEPTKEYVKPRNFQEAWNNPDPVQRGNGVRVSTRSFIT